MNISPVGTRSVHVSYDDGENIHLAAFVSADRWNGFAVPYFTTEVGHEIAALCVPAYEGEELSTFEYNEAEDTFTEVRDDDRQPVDYFDENGERFHNLGSGWTWEEHKPLPTDAAVLETIARARVEILEDLGTRVSHGDTMPADLTSFAELHDYVDANMYGGMADDDAPFDWMRGEHAAKVQDALDLWMRAGRFPHAHAIIPADVTADRPWFLTVEDVELDGFRAQLWERHRTSGEWVPTGFSARFGTEDEARTWAINFATKADGIRTARFAEV